MQKLRIGVIGAGSWTRICHIPCLQADERVVVTALCGRRIDHVQTQAAEFGIPAVYTHYQDLIASPQVDAVTIATPNVDHHPIAMAAIEAGKHVFCEKPLAMNAQQSELMWHTAKAKGVVHQVAFTFRHLYATGFARRLLHENAIGSVYRVSGYAEGTSGFNPERPYNWRDTRELAGTGMLGDMGSHLVDLARFITGMEFTRVAGQMRTLPRSDEDPGRRVTTDDDAEFLARMSGGVDGYFRISRIVRHEPRAYLELCGTEGALRVHYSRGNIDAVYRCPASTNTYTLLPLPAGAQPEPNHALYKMLSAFVDECLGMERPVAAATFADGHRAQEILDAVVRSAAKDSTWSPVGWTSQEVTHDSHC